jgi:surfactin synthase thioesterase subunit
VAVRLFCIPFVGAGAAAFHAWHDVVPAGIDVCALRFPGRESRVMEAAYDDMDELVDALATELDGWLELPYAFVGACSGGIVALELARRLRAHGRPTPSALFAAACPAPRLRGEETAVHRLPLDQMLAEVSEFGGLSEEVMENAELLELLEPTLRADLRLAETWRYRADAPLDVPVVVIGGLDDDVVRPDELLAWHTETRRTFSMRLIEGDHFVLTSAPKLAARVVALELEELLDRTASERPVR